MVVGVMLLAIFLLGAFSLLGIVMGESVPMIGRTVGGVSGSLLAIALLWSFLQRGSRCPHCQTDLSLLTSEGQYGDDDEFSCPGCGYSRDKG